MKRGYTSWCKECENSASKSRYVPKPPVEKTKKPYNPLTAIKRRLRNRYNITHGKYLELYEKQEGKCAICGEERDLGGTGGLYVDHNHRSGEVRGLLCPGCNAAIGIFKDDVNLMQKAINYLLNLV
jgi:hypothetical protein